MEFRLYGAKKFDPSVGTVQNKLYRNSCDIFVFETFVLV